MKKCKRTVLLLLLCGAISLSLIGCVSGGTDGGDGSEAGGEVGNGNDGEEGKEENGMKNGETRYSSESEIMFISSGLCATDAANKLMKHMNEKIIGEGGRAFMGNAYIPEGECQEIIVGYVPDRKISVKAYELLGDIASSSPIRESRFLVYAEDGNLAIAYEENTLTSAQTVESVVDKLISELLSDESAVTLEKGVQLMGTLDLIQIQEAIDSKEIESRWQALREKIGDDDTYLALRDFFERLFSDEIIAWMGTLYDPATGLCYSSTSGKNADVFTGETGYYPHPEATNSILNRLLSTGMLRYVGNDYTKFLPRDMQYKIVYYLKTIQDPVNGEFYIPQMNKSTIAPERVGRDHSACISLLGRMKASPTYDIGTLKGDGITADEYWAALVADGLTTDDEKPVIYWHWAHPSGHGTTSELKESRTEAVSRAVEASAVKKTANINDIFTNHDTFIAHLLTKDPYNSPYGAISNINSISSIVNSNSERLGAYDSSMDADKVAKTIDVRVGDETKKLVILAGDTLNTINIKWMNLYINEAGLFGKVTNNYDSDGNPVYDGFFGGWGYNNTNGFMKAAVRYGSAKIAFPEPWLAAESLLKAINSPESAAANGNILVIYNVWSSLGSLKSNVRAYYEGDDKEELLQYIESGLYGKVDLISGAETARTYVAIAIDNAYDKIQPFKKADAGYGHSPSRGTPGWQGNLPVGIASENMSDTDATFCTTTSLGASICSVLGISMDKEVPMHSEADLLLFLDTISRQEYVVKRTPTELKYGD